MGTFMYFSNMKQQRLYPVGIQTFSKIREGNYLYVDKTAQVYRLTHHSAKYVFLSRPRRFGKSLLASTLHAYFEGRKELFQGLAIEQLEKEWEVSPVLHFDMSTAKHQTAEGLESELERKLIDYEVLYGCEEGSLRINQRLDRLIKEAYRQTGQKVVVLIDEYDASLLDVVHEEENLPKLRQVMRNFYSPLKACDPYLRFVFLTGITKFSQLSVFSELNNITNVSMFPEYAAICGITQEEVLTQMAPDLEAFADKSGITPAEMMEKLKRYYDGYHFAWPSPDVFNPFSLLSAFAFGQLKYYWFESGTPTYIIELLRKYQVQPSQIGEKKVMDYSFDVPLEQACGHLAVLYQSGYLTIKDCHLLSGIYTLDIPNQEVRIGLMRSLLPNYLDSYAVVGSQNTLAEMFLALHQDDMDSALTLLQTFLSTIPYCDHTDYEGHYQQMLYILFSLLGVYVDIEVRTPRGRVDMVLRTATTLYVVELKLNESAEAAMQQIDLKKYPERFALCGLPVVKVGINFNSETHTLKDWKIERV